MTTYTKVTLFDEAWAYVVAHPGHDKIRRLPREYKLAMTKGYVAFRLQSEGPELERHMRGFIEGLHHETGNTIPGFHSSPHQYGEDVHFWRLHLERWFSRRGVKV